MLELGKVHDEGSLQDYVLPNISQDTIRMMHFNRGQDYLEKALRNRNLNQSKRGHQAGLRNKMLPQGKLNI